MNPLKPLLLGLILLSRLSCLQAQGVWSLKTADSLFDEGDLKAAITVYRQVFAQTPNNIVNTYNFTCALALSGEKDSAFRYLGLIMDQSTSTEEPNYALTDPDFLSLRTDPRWAALEQRMIKSLQEKTGAPVDIEYARKLWHMAAQDQAYYKELNRAKRKFGVASPAVKAIQAKIEKVNRMQVPELEQLIAEKGWPKKSQVGSAAITAAFLVIQHSTLEKQQRYLPVIEKRCKEGEGRYDLYTLMFDRIRVEQHLPQRYGTQSFFNGRKYVPYPLEHRPEAVNAAAIAPSGGSALFEDNFVQYAEGTFPARWQLVNRPSEYIATASVMEIEGVKALTLTHGNIAGFMPVFPKGFRLGDEFTVAYDYLLDSNSCKTRWGAGICLRDSMLVFERAHALTLWPEDGGSYEYCPGTDSAGARNSVIKNSSYKGAFKMNAWHHVSLIYKRQTIDLYLDSQLIVSTRTCLTPVNISFEGIATFAISNVRISNNDPGELFGNPAHGCGFTTQIIQFEVNKAVIRPEGMKFIQQLATWLKRQPAVKLQINGHTDEEGTSEYNLQLSRKRAEAIKDQLVLLGIRAERLSAKGFGAGKPLDRSASEAGRARNRRVEFSVL